MTNQEIADLLSGAMRMCPGLPGAICDHGTMRTDGGEHSGPCEVCAPPHGDRKGRVYVLGEEARVECFHASFDLLIPQKDCRLCGGRGWASGLLLAEEKCWGCPDCKLAAWVIVDSYIGCGGFGTIRRWDLDKLMRLLEAAGYIVNYTSKGWWVVPPEFKPTQMSRVLAVAACGALGLT